MSRNGILVDYQYCTGCYSCEVACQAEHELPLEQWGVKVMQNGPWPIREADGTPTRPLRLRLHPVVHADLRPVRRPPGQGKAPELRVPLPGEVHGVRSRSTSS